MCTKTWQSWKNQYCLIWRCEWGKRYANWEWVWYSLIICNGKELNVDVGFHFKFIAVLNRDSRRLFCMMEWDSIQIIIKWKKSEWRGVVIMTSWLTDLSLDAKRVRWDVKSQIWKKLHKGRIEQQSRWGWRALIWGLHNSHLSRLFRTLRLSSSWVLR